MEIEKPKEYQSKALTIALVTIAVLSVSASYVYGLLKGAADTEVPVEIVDHSPSPDESQFPDYDEALMNPNAKM